MPSGPLQRIRAAAALPLRALRTLYFFEVWVLAMLAAQHLLFWATGFGSMAWTVPLSFYALRHLPLLLLAGMAAIAAWEAASRRSWQGAGWCLARWREPSWWLATLRIGLAVVATTHVYMWLKLYIPLLNPRLFDAMIWEWEERVFFGYSPNVFILELFRDPWVLTGIDWSYPRVFLLGLYAGLAMVVALPSDRVRKPCFTAYVVLWTLGGWLHVLVPAMGPCYWFSSVWAPVADRLRESVASQAALLKNYQDLTIHRGSGGMEINPMYGVAAFPSMHNASQVLLALWAGWWNRWAALAVWASAAVIFIGSVLTGWHYLVDSVAGAALAAGVYWAVVRAGNLQKGPTPPGPSCGPGPE